MIDKEPVEEVERYIEAYNLIRDYDIMSGNIKFRELVPNIVEQSIYAGCMEVHSTHKGNIGVVEEDLQKCKKTAAEYGKNIAKKLEEMNE
jgi:hypothetical protein